jgi:hypothetical protein
MDLVIRHVNDRDLEAVHEILTSPHVVAGSLRVPLAPLQQTRERLTPDRGIYQPTRPRSGCTSAPGSRSRAPCRGGASAPATGWTRT